MAISAKIEEELSSLSSEEKQMFLSELGINTSGLDNLIKVAYDILGLRTFLL